jgi:hypothetical protein
MSWYALEEIEEALSETKSLLLPFDLAMWSKLALIVFLTGSGFNMPNTGGVPSQNTGGQSDFNFGEFDSTQVPESSEVLSPVAQSPQMENLVTGMASGAASGMLVAAVLAVLLVIGLPLMFLSSVFEFIFYQSLIDRDVKIRKNFSDHLGNGARYFGFKLAYLLALFLLLGLVAATVVVSDMLLVLGILLALPLIFVLGIFSGLTHDFVLLRMMESDEKLIEAWKSFWPTLKSEWKEVAVFLLVKFFLGLVVGIAAGIIVIIATVLLLIPFGIFAFLIAMIAEVLVLLPVVIGLLTWFVVMLYVAVPFRVYIYYFVILVYHDLTA